MRVYNIVIESNKPMNQDFQSPPMQLNQMYGCSIQAVYTGVPSGVIKLQSSSDPNNTGILPVNWTDITPSVVTLTGAGSFTWNVWTTMYNWIRLAYVDTSGGTSNAVLTATFNGKGM